MSDERTGGPGEGPEQQAGKGTGPGGTVKTGGGSGGGSGGGGGKSGLRCSFCGRGPEQVEKLITGPDVHICNECVALCNDILREEEDREPDFDLETLRAEAPKEEGNTLPAPSPTTPVEAPPAAPAAPPVAPPAAPPAVAD